MARPVLWLTDRIAIVASGGNGFGLTHRSDCHVYLIDGGSEAALIDALAERRIAGAGLDVFDDEPHVPAALMALDNVVLTPHTASATHETRRAMADLVLENLHAFYTSGAVRVPVPGTVSG